MFEKYYHEKNVEFNLYAYAPPGTETGDYFPNKEIDFAKDLRTVERYREYMDVGFNLLFTGTTGTYFGEEWETSMCKKVMDNAYKAGLKKIIVSDERIYYLSREADGLIGEGKKFDSEESLDNFVRDCIKNYSGHPAFYGILFCDEPHYYLFKSFGQLYRSIKRVRPQTFVHCNLLPLDTLLWMDPRYPKGGSLLERREKYLKMFLDETGCDYIMYDDYPFCTVKENKVYYLRCLQDAAKLCTERKVRFSFVAQSFYMFIGKNEYYYLPNEEEMRFQLNLLLGFGVKELGFYTYMPHGNNHGENYPGDSGMLTREGEKTEMYYIVQKIIKELHSIAPVVANFEYRRSAYELNAFKSFLKSLDWASNEELERITSFNTDKEAVLINELYDKKNGAYLYRVINLADIRCEELKGVRQNTAINFDKRFTGADIYIDGKWSKIEGFNGSAEVSLLPGEAAYILVY
jgi:hypothetical protein